jgi:hypothetical protein
LKCEFSLSLSLSLSLSDLTILSTNCSIEIDRYIETYAETRSPEEEEKRKE